MKFVNTTDFYKVKTTLDLVNGIHLSVTFEDPDTSPGDIFKITPRIIKNLYLSLGSFIEDPKITTVPPSAKDLEKTQDSKNLLLVLCIAPNSKTMRHHLHAFVYFVHNFSIDLERFFKDFDRMTRQIPGISTRGWPVFYTAVTDPLDQQIRKNGLNYLADYIKRREYPSLVHYFDNKNSKNFLYHYEQKPQNIGVI
jgi:hypothetical protein